MLLENLQELQLLFLATAQIKLGGYRDFIDQIINLLQTKDFTVTLLRNTLSGNFAGVVTMPHAEFLLAAQETHYDLYALCNHHMANSEQACR